MDRKGRIETPNTLSLGGDSNRIVYDQWIARDIETPNTLSLGGDSESSTINGSQETSRLLTPSRWA